MAEPPKDTRGTEKTSLTKFVKPAVPSALEATVAITNPEHQIEMDLATAKKILQDVIEFDESSISEATDLTQLGGHNYGLIRQALIVTGKDLLDKYGKPNPSIDAVSKQAPEGELRLLISTYIPSIAHIQLLLHNGGNYLIRADIPLQDTSSNNALYAGLFDHRKDPQTNVNQNKRGFDTQRVKDGWRGIRWTADNILHWDGPRKLPEDLDRTRLSKDTAQLKGLPPPK